MKTVLAPIDFSSVSQRVIGEATTIARAIGARLVLLHVVQLPAVVGSGVSEADLPKGFCLQAEKDAANRLAELQRQLRAEGVTAHVVRDVGRPGERIVAEAERLEADYLVMGSHGHGAFYDLIVGSTTMRVLREAKCTVAIVPPAGEKSRQAKRPARLGSGRRQAD
jgi:nucleotide-binding universal stress UspA family protein